jgi:hypothetical protein
MVSLLATCSVDGSIVAVVGAGTRFVGFALSVIFADSPGRSL